MIDPLERRVVANQSSSLSIPNEWQEKFLLKRIDEKDVELSLEERNAVLRALDRGSKFAQIRKFTIMLNSVKSIDPLWGELNIPPRPELKTEGDVVNGVFLEEVTNQKELDLWDRLFAGKIS